MTAKDKICIDCGIACSRERCRSCANKGENNPAWGNEYNLGRKHTEESKLKMVETRRRNGNLGKMTEEMKRKISKNSNPFWKGKKLPEEMVRKGVETRMKNGSYKMSDETRRKQSLALRGDKCHLWRGGKTKKNKLLRESVEGKIWRESVFKRDNYICQHKKCKFCLNKVGVFLNAHHIKPLSKFPELAHEVDNGITYCQDYHLSGKHGYHQFVGVKK